MELFLNRDIKSVKSTTGKLCVNGVFECFILEDKDRDLKQSMTTDEIKKIKVKGATCIPTGKYQVAVTFSNRFQKELPLLLNVPGFEGIRIHPGNTAEDTEGCLLPGEGRSYDNVIMSRKAFDKLFAQIKQALTHEKVFITIQ